MTLSKSTIAAAICLAATGFAAQAQAPYAYPGYAYGPAPAAPPSWSFDPYTNGMSACVQYRPSDPDSCKRQREPTYGQPSYGPPR